MMLTTTPSSATSQHSVSSLNKRAIQLVQQGDSRTAVKLFLQALSALKAQLKQPTPANGHRALPTANGSGFLRVVLPKSSSNMKGNMSMYEVLFGLKNDPCAPTQTDGSTACLLYNMALSHHRRCGGNTAAPMVGRAGLLKKAVMTYGMALSAARHWKRHTTPSDHAGCQMLTLAIVNNLLVLHHDLGDMDKVTQLHGVLRDALFSQGGDEIQSEEFSLFAKNLQRCYSNDPVDDHDVKVQAEALTNSSNNVMYTFANFNERVPAARHQSAMVGFHSA